jgi:hypothetical protein
MLERLYLLGCCLNYMSASVAGMLKLFVIYIESNAGFVETRRRESVGVCSTIAAA